MPVAGAARRCSLIVQSTQHVDIVAERSQRIEARREPEIRSRLARDPVAFGNAVAIEPEDEAILDGLSRHRVRGVSRAGGVEHAHQRRQANLDGTTRQG